MAIKATVESRFTYGIQNQEVVRKVSETTFPFHFELDEEIMLMVEGYWKGLWNVEDYEHDGMQTVIKSKLGAVVVITYEEI